MKPKSKFPLGKLILACAVVLGLIAAIPQAQAQTFSVLYSFTGGSDGAGPLDGLALDSAGNLYATTNTGGTDNFGVVFKVTTSGVESVVHNFTGAMDGAYPEGALIRDKAGNFYGTTLYGGTQGGFGTVFKLNTKGKLTLLHSFVGSDGATPYGGVIRDAKGNLYGTTLEDGSDGNGVVWKLTP